MHQLRFLIKKSIKILKEKGSTRVQCWEPLHGELGAPSGELGAPQGELGAPMMSWGAPMVSRIPQAPHTPRTPIPASYSCWQTPVTQETPLPPFLRSAPLFRQLTSPALLFVIKLFVFKLQ